MKVSFRTLKGAKFELDAEPAESVLDLKKRYVKNQHDSDDYEGYRLIFKGKILDNAKSLTDAGVTGAGFIVVMPPKKPPAKPEAKPPAAAAASSGTPNPPQPTPANEPAPAAPAADAPLAAADAPAAPAAPGAGGGAPDTSLVTGAAYDASVAHIVQMGFPEAEVKRALRAAFNNPDRAVEFLCSGIPAAQQDAPTAATPTATARAAGGGGGGAPPATGAAATGSGGGAPPATGAAATGGGGGTAAATPGMPFNMFDQTAGGAGGGDGRGRLDFLRQLPPFNNMRRVIQANPSVVGQLLRQLEQSDPALLQLINSNREEFLRLIHEPVEEGAEGGGEEVMEALAQQMAQTGAGGGGPPQPGPGQIMVTEEENEVILRLTELGSTMGLQQAHCVEAWLACDRDENLAANFLLTQAEEMRRAQAEEAAQGGGNPEGGEGGEGGGDPPAGGGN